jgi:CDP-6-deoxy-D-xylo-4-hexulose-3-dehydrase
LGATLHGKFTGNFGLASSQSSFYSHHLSTMEGGWIQTDDKDFADICKSLRAHGWIRELDRNSQFAISTGEEFRDRFQFVLPGLNFRPLEFEGAIGLEQLKKFPQMMKIRLKNASTFQNLFGELPFVKIQQGPGTSSWFAFSLILKGVLAGKRKELTRTLFERGIECRPVIAGNFTKQPVMKYLSGKVPFSLEVANSVDLEGFYVGNHPHDLGTQLQELREVIDEFASSVI